MLSHSASCALVRQKAQQAMEHLADFLPYKVRGPVVLKVEFTPPCWSRFQEHDGTEKVNDDTWIFRGKAP